MPPDRAADRFAASFSARARTRSETPPRRCRDCGNGATARRPPGDAPRSARHRSRRGRSRRKTPGNQNTDGANLVSPARIGRAEIARNLERLGEVLANDDVETEQ